MLVNNAGCMVNTRELTKETIKYLLKEKQLPMSVKKKADLDTYVVEYPGRPLHTIYTI